jgi:hypothetical protein
MAMKNPTPPRILALWSAPRSRSTAFLRMMTERGDHTVVHEPFSQVVNFGTVEVGPHTAHSDTEVIAALGELAAGGPVFFKDTTDYDYPAILADRDFRTTARHTFIIRHPREAIASHCAVNSELRREDIGFLAALYDAVAAATGDAPVVVDSDDLIDRPEQTVRTYCELVGLDFRAEALSWRSGMRDEWRKTQPWHESTSRTNGFTRTEPAYTRTVDNDPVLAGHFAYHLPFYERLHARRMTVPTT